MSTKTVVFNAIAPRYTISDVILKNGTRTTTQTNSYSTNALTRTRTGVTNPLYKSQIKLGLNASTDFSATAIENHFTLGHYHLHRKLKTEGSSPTTQVQQTYDVVWCPGLSDPTATHLNASEANNLALIDFYKRARNAQRSFQSGTFIGELIEVLHMIRNPAKAFRSGLTDYFAIVKKRSKGIRRLPERLRKKTAEKVIADSYLEAAFGWQPLLSDIDDGARALAQISERAVREYKLVRGKGSTSTAVDQATVVNTIGTSTAIRARLSERNIKTAEVMYYGSIYLTDDVSSSIQPRLLGFTLSDLVPTAWNLLPWSFLIDYFSNIGDVLEAWSFQRSEIRWCSKVVRRINTDVFTHTHDPANIAPTTFDIISQSAIDGKSSAIRKEITRTGSVSVGLPAFRFELPFKSNKWLNIAALVAARRQGP